MRLIFIDEAQPGMILAKPIYREKDGKVLLMSHSELTASYIQKIKEHGYEYITICTEDDLALGETILPIREETRYKAVSILKETTRKIHQNKEFDTVQIKDVVSDMIDQILEKPEIVYNLNEINTHDNYTYSHSINVSILALMTGALMGLRRSQLETLGIAGLLHDIGKVTITEELLNKPSSLEPHEFEVIKNHTRNGFEILKTRFPQSFLPANVALQHHERMDGSGYPKGISGEKIHYFTKIVAVADVYDAMTSNRIYQAAQPAYIGIREVVSNINTKYDPLVVDQFTRIIAPYSVGSVLMLENGDKAIVTFVSRKKCLIRFVSGSRHGLSYDLYQSPELKVNEVVPNQNRS